MNELKDKTAIVTGGSRGFGRGIVEALAAQDMQVYAIARNKERLATLQRETEGRVETIAANVTDAVAAAKIMQGIRPDVLILNAGASPLLRPVHLHTWESFSLNWETDVKGAFLWAREAMLLPLEPDSTVMITSSGAARQGSPASGGYAGAKAMQWMMARYFNEESQAQNLGLRFHTILPKLTPETELGQAAVAAYAKRAGVSTEQFLEKMGPPLTPAMAGKAIVNILTKPEYSEQVAYMLTADGLQPID